MNSSFINKYGYSTLLLQSSIIVLLALFFLLAPSTVLAEEIKDKENTVNSESLDDNGNSEITKDDDTTTEDTAETDEAVEDEPIIDDQLDSDETEDIENVDRDEIDNIDEEVENDGDENVDDVDEETENVDDTDEIDEEEIDREHDEDLIDEAEDEAAEEDEAEDETEKDESSKEDSTSKQSPSKSTTSTRSNSEFKNGDRNNQVIQLKKDLTKVGFGGMNVNDLYGSFTEQRVKEFQKYFGLEITGIADDQTRSRINSIANSPLQEGKRHAKTTQLKKDLNKVGFGGMNINNLYGSFTAQRVSEFQKHHNLKVNGIADDVTLAKISSLADAIFQEGDRHDDIIQLKKDLNKLGFGGMNINDLYGSFTAQRVSQFQEYFGLKATGIAENITRSKVKSVANSPLQEGKRHNDTIQIKKDLNKLGFGGMNINDLYGSFTAQRVTEFQKHYGLKVNGIADDVTLAKITSSANAVFHEGDRHNDVIQLKKDLDKLGFGGMNINDLYGSFTAQRVSQFQKYFGLKATGIAENVTRSKVKSVANSPLQQGKRHNDTIQMKKDLNKIGFGGMNINNLYGNFTAQRVTEFQKHYSLKVNGIADDVTLAKITSIANTIFQEGDRHNDVIQLKKDLTKVGFGGMNLNNLYGSFTAQRVSQFQKYFGLKATGIAENVTRSKVKSVANSPLQQGKRHNDTIQMKRDLNKIGFGGMNINNLYGSFTAQRVTEFQKHYGLKVNGIADEVTLAKIIEIAAKPSKVIYLDAGHGGSDPGAIGNGLHEKDVTLDIALRTKKELEAAGYTVIMSRTTDKYLSLSERTNHANRVNADIFVSIHINAGGGTGIETWKMANGPKPSESNKLATHIQNETIKQTGSRDRGVKDKNLHVNRESNMPSALVELGFIDTVSDANKLKQASFKNKAAKGIANGIKKYFA